MKGDDERAEQLAAMLDGGPVTEEIEPFTAAVRRVRDVLSRLSPDPDRVAALLPRLYEGLIAAQSQLAIELAHPTVYVRDMQAALAFYRDGLGLRVVDEGKWLSLLAAGSANVALHWTGSATQRPQVGDIRLEFRADDLDRAVSALRGGGMRVEVRVDPYRRERYAEVHDPDGHLVRVFGGLNATQRVQQAPRESISAASGKPNE
ncbi:MAG: VOC family protein [Deltaproteobacteria bacterium]|nr:VOC family protein [Deltaproteobacteria bacterium]MBI3390129.1 VOC family protein [Deltaproteobacteria bacterium]